MAEIPRCVVETRANQLAMKRGFEPKTCPFFVVGCLGVTPELVRQIGFPRAVEQCPWVNYNLHLQSESQRNARFFLFQNPDGIDTRSGLDRFMSRLEKTKKLRKYGKG